jgi:amidohydrolase
MSPTKIFDEANSLQKELVSIRRTIHEYPELSFQEKKTSEFIANTLKKIGYQVTTNIAVTGITAEIGNGNTVGIRADMDALPIQEENPFDFASKNKNVMHACGHDAHMACALGAAFIIQKLHAQGKLNGKIRFIFQPSEESINEDGKSGARLMLEEGAVNDLKALFSLHVFPSLKSGTVAIKKEVLLAACDSFEIVIKGKGSHGAFPETGIDPIVLAANIIQSIQTIVSRRKSALDPLIITIGGIRSKTFVPNVIAEAVELTGTVRYFNKDMHKFALDHITKACNIAAVLGGSFDIKYVHEIPALYNNPDITNLVESVAIELLGKQNVLNIDPQLGGDDFSYFSQKIPSCYFILGVGNGDCSKKLHTANFDIDENALPIGAAILAESAIRFLAQA